MQGWQNRNNTCKYNIFDIVLYHLIIIFKEQIENMLINLRKYIVVLILFFNLLLMVNCKHSDDSILYRLQRIDSIMESNPQIAYDSIIVIKSTINKSIDKEAWMTLRMLEVKSLNKLYKQLPSDSSFFEVVDYFDKNTYGINRAQCYYLLGGIYRDAHDTPKAIEIYKKAIEILEDKYEVDNKQQQQLLALSYGEVADLLYSQLLYTDAIHNYKQAIAYA